MEITKVLIEKFLSDRSTDQEAEAVSDYFEEHPEELETYLPMSEWDEIKSSKPELPKSISRKIKRSFDLEAVKDIPKQNPTVVSIRFKRRLMAACVFVLVASALFIYGNCVRKSWHVDATSFTAKLNVQLPLDDTCINNVTNHKWDITMPDGSSLLLSQNSSIQFSKKFIPRQVKLKGKCYFSITRDTKNPFTVVTGPTETTVLGTSFTISELERKGAIRFDLFTGKILIRFKGTKAANSKSIFLSPGASMRFNIKTNTTSFIEEPIAIVTKKKAPVTRMNYIRQTDQQIDFDHAPLPLVLESLQQCYHVNIDFKNQQFDNLHFSGTILKSLPVERVIDNIAVINDLTVQSFAGGFVLRKLKKNKE